ncbi:hypothetical protein F8A10_07645 [Paracoccus kondratievae]|uniref:glycine-rich domain-containing protein n=1 Tax=Paracoccus kondratievae TaxID=135740 RepID=UPI0012664D96|nr:hypothetical protein [Paracoccus kondratievae]QFQ87306.1 hypothetical protein F8A10_07645 [Paracoccus kondratievae]
MPKLDLTRARRIKTATGKVSALKGAGFVWRLPTLTVTDAQITPFARGGVDYVEIMFRQSGSFTLSEAAPVRYSLWSGAASGGSRSSGGNGSGGGGAGWFAEGADLPAGSYDVTIGAGGVGSAGLGNDGSPSSLAGPLSITVPGGGGGGSASSVGNAPGRPGGNGGGGSGDAGTNWPGGDGDPGNDGGRGYSSSTISGRAGGGGGGAGGPGQDAALGAPGAGGPGILLDWIAIPITAGIGGNGSLGTAGGTSPNMSNACGSNGIYGASSGAGGDGFMVLVVRADEVIVEVAA